MQRCSTTNLLEISACAKSKLLLYNYLKVYLSPKNTLAPWFGP